MSWEIFHDINILLPSISSCSFGKKCEFQELTNLLHGFLLTGDRSVEAVAVTARVVMKQSADFLGNFVSIINLLLTITELSCPASLYWRARPGSGGCGGDQAGDGLRLEELQGGGDLQGHLRPVGASTFHLSAGGFYLFRLHSDESLLKPSRESNSTDCYFIIIILFMCIVNLFSK